MKAQMWEIAGYTDKGPVKETNQDSFLFRTACSARGWAAILGVADGISGLGRGETASRKMMENLLNWWEDNVLRSQTERRAWPRTLETMLLETNRAITDIPLSCVFKYSNYFGDAFRHVKGVSPNHYRKNREMI